jgi:hypothetical protein
MRSGGVGRWSARICAILRLRLLSTAPLALVLVAMMLGGCGGSSSSGNGIESKAPAEIVAISKIAANSASSVHVSGSVVSNGAPITLNLELLAGKGGRGRISENGLSFDLIQVGKTAYISGSPAFYSHFGGSAAAQLFKGKWLKESTSSGGFSALGSLTNLSQLVDSALASHGTLEKGATTTVNGQQVLSITDPSHGGTLYIATTGKAYPIQIVKSGASGGKILFDRWNEPVKLVAPKNAIDLSQLQANH